MKLMQYAIQTMVTLQFTQYIHQMPITIKSQMEYLTQVKTLGLLHQQTPAKLNILGPFRQNHVFNSTLIFLLGTNITSNMHPVMAAFLEIMNDNYLRFIIFGLSAVLQTITTDCPTALVWHYFGENKSPTSLLASPLDYLPRFVSI